MSKASSADVPVVLQLSVTCNCVIKCVCVLLADSAAQVNVEGGGWKVEGRRGCRHMTGLIHFQDFFSFLIQSMFDQVLNSGPRESDDQQVKPNLKLN